MIHKKVIDKISLSVCAIERSSFTLDQLQQHKGPPLTWDQDVIGTGFIIHPGWVLTNRHVVDAIMNDLRVRKEPSLDHWFLEWVFPNDKGQWASHLMEATLLAPLTTQGHSGLDVALIRYTHSDSMNPCRPVRFGRLDQIRVGADIAICGYLGGTNLLRKLPGAPRFGPLVHAGIVSGVAPYGTARPRSLRAILTDFNTGTGFSGSPMFDPKSGLVWGLHHSGSNKGTYGIGLPVDDERATGWVSFVEKAIADGKTSVSGFAVDSGDLVTDPGIAQKPPQEAG